MKIINYKILAIIFSLSVILLNGCETVPPAEFLPTYAIGNISYTPLIALCESKGISWDYDTFTGLTTLNKNNHKINFRLNDTLIIIDGKPQHLKHPVQLYQGAIVIPSKFKEEILETIFPSAVASKEIQLPLIKIHKVVLDAGHGGSDPGTIGKTGMREKFINLDMAYRLKKILEDSGVEVVMTRSSDVFIPLERRVEIANKSKADIFISIHANANRVRSLNGFEVYYINSTFSLDSQRALESAKENPLDLENCSLLNRTLTLKAILWDMIYTSNRAEAVTLAKAICRQMSHDLDVRVIGTKSANFYVLKGTNIPSILLEIGFLSNQKEETRLSNSYYRQQLAEALAKGIQSYARDYRFTEASP
jgi:N-acetylmuramoyl-L-alanine amidase